jgi:hypothetical protein
MKYVLLIATFLLNFNLFAQHLAVFAKEDACDLDSKTPCKPKSAKEIAFYEAYGKAVKKGLDPKVEIKFETPPLQWGVKVREENYGGLAYLESYSEAFVTDLALTNLLPDHGYKLCLNGKPDLVGNDLLPTPVPGHVEEKYYDFLTIKTDSKGEYHANLAVILKPGNYHVRFYVKDIENHKIILYYGYFKFTVN